MDNGNTPTDYGLPHPSWRPYQHDTVLDALTLEQKDVLLLEAPTGSGKTAVARAVGSQHSITSLCKTKVLQRENYEAGYGFEALFGRGNYPCALDPMLTGSECEYAERGMHKCPEAGSCEYLRRKEAVIASGLRSLNYAYWLNARGMRKRHPTDYVACDEAHLLSETVLEYTGATITSQDCSRWNLPAFPSIDSTSDSMLVQADPIGEAIHWLRLVRAKLLTIYRTMEKQQPHTLATVRKMRSCEKLGRKVAASISALEASQDDWYIVSGSRARKVRGRYEPAFVCRPLTARHHAPSFFLDGWRTIFMSATIGAPDTFTEELGIPLYRANTVPSVWPAERRPVLVPANLPRLGQSAKREGPAAYDRQACIIAGLVNSAPTEWCGVIHHTSIMGARELAGRLAQLGLGDRIWLPPERTGTEQQMAAWHTRRRKASNSLAIPWSWHTGVDLLDERICIIAKVPFPVLGTKYERARMSYSGKFYLQRTAWALEQACGRTRRGREEDYDTPKERRGLVAIADGNWKRCQKYLSGAFLESITEV